MCSGQGPCWASDSALVGCFIRFHCHFLIATAVHEATLATGEPSESLQAIAETHNGQGGRSEGVLIALDDSCLGAYSVVHGEVTGPALTTIGQPLLGFPGFDFSTSRHHQRTSQASPWKQSSSAGGSAKYISDIVDAKTCS